MSLTGSAELVKIYGSYSEIKNSLSFISVYLAQIKNNIAVIQASSSFSQLSGGEVTFLSNLNSQATTLKNNIDTTLGQMP